MENKVSLLPSSSIVGSFSKSDDFLTVFHQTLDEKGQSVPNLYQLSISQTINEDNLFGKEKEV